MFTSKFTGKSFKKKKQRRRNREEEEEKLKDLNKYLHKTVQVPPNRQKSINKAASYSKSMLQLLRYFTFSKSLSLHTHINTHKHTYI